MNSTPTAAAALIALLVLTGCSAASTPPAPSVEPAAPTASDTPTPAPSSDSPTTSDRGNLIKDVGDSFGFAVDGADAATFVITSITVDPDCSAEYAESPEFGHFVKLDIEGETTAALREDVFIAGGSWSVVADNGTTFNGDPWSYGAVSCLPQTEMLPPIIGPGERVAGAVVLDVPTTQGTIVLDLGNGAAWEWQY